MDEAQEAFQKDFTDWVDAHVQLVEAVPERARWCPSWWDHPEAVQRLFALYEAWEEAKRTRSLSRWWLSDWDPQILTLTRVGGVFTDCKTEHVRQEHRPLTLTPLPKGLTLNLPQKPPEPHIDGDDGDDGDEIERRLREERDRLEAEALAALDEE